MAAFCVCGLLLPGCGDTAGSNEPGAAAGLAVLGGGTHSLDAVNLTIMGNAEDGLDVPTDLAFDPDSPATLWVMNQAPELAPPPPRGTQPFRNAPPMEFWPSVTVYFDLGAPHQSVRHIVDPWGVHHMANVTSLVFGATHIPHRHRSSDVGGLGDPRTFATCHESRNEFKGYREPNDFMGPNLWSAQLEAEEDPELDYFGESFPHAIELVQANCRAECPADDEACFGACDVLDLGSHLDMLHESPNCMGIAWERDNVYWVMDGCGGSQWDGRMAGDCEDAGDIVRYDFMTDHGPGQDDHSDGVIERYATGIVRRVPGVPSHMEIDHFTQELFAVDSGNNRILVLDIGAGTRGAELPVREAGPTHYAWEGARIRTLLQGADHGMEVPSGLSLYGDYVLVTDYRLGVIYAFDRAGGLVDYLDLGVGAGALMGIEAAANGDVLGVDARRNQVWRLSPGDRRSAMGSG